jgi:hypothetical protein
VLRWQLAHPGGEDGPEIPMAGRRLWGIFIDLNASRASGMGPSPISYVEIEAWSRLRREPVRPFEVTMLRALDRAYLEAARADKTRIRSRLRRRCPRGRLDGFVRRVFGQ